MKWRVRARSQVQGERVGDSGSAASSSVGRDDIRPNNELSTGLAELSRVRLSMRPQLDAASSRGEFGFTTLDADSRLVDDRTVGGSHREQSTGRSGYTRSGDNGKLRTTGYNLAAIIADQPEKATR